MSKKMAVLNSDNLVENIIVAQDWEPETPTLLECQPGKYVSIGFTYDEARDAFIPSKPYESWVLNEDTCLWEAPTPKPDGDFVWDEQSSAWVEVEIV